MRETHQGKARYNIEVRLPTMKLGPSSQGSLLYSLSFWWKASIQHTGGISYMSHDIPITFLSLLPRCSMTSWSLRYSDGPVTTSVIGKNWDVAFKGLPDRLFLHTFLFSGFRYILYHPATLFFSCFSEHSKFLFTSHFFSVMYLVRETYFQNASVFLHISLCPLMFRNLVCVWSFSLMYPNCLLSAAIFKILAVDMWGSVFDEIE